MPPGRIWPKRLQLRGKTVSQRHRITVSFGEPITPTGDTTQLIESVQHFFDTTNGGGTPYRSPYARIGARRED
jgi:hypothetical protein